MDLIVFCTHEYEWLVPPHAALLDRHAPGMRMVYYGDRTTGDLPGNVEFRRAPHLADGEDWSWAEDDWGPYGGFGVGFRACMEEHGRDVALFTFPDFWPASPVDAALLDDLAAFVRAQPKLMRVQVGCEVGGADVSKIGRVVAEWRGVEIATTSASGPSHEHWGGFHWFPSLWNVPLLLDFLIPECSHWGFEASHQKKMEARPDLWSAWPTRPAWVLNHVHDRTEPGANLTHLSPGNREVAKAHLRPGTMYYEREHGWRTA